MHSVTPSPSLPRSIAGAFATEPEMLWNRESWKLQTCKTACRRRATLPRMSSARLLAGTTEQMVYQYIL